MMVMLKPNILSCLPLPGESYGLWLKFCLAFTFVGYHNNLENCFLGIMQDVIRQVQTESQWKVGFE